MKKIILPIFVLLFFLSVVSLLTIPSPTSAATWCESSSVTDCCDKSYRGTEGLVPCGQGGVICKVTVGGGGYSIGDTIPCDSAACVPGPASPNGAAGCTGSIECRCELYHTFFLALNAYKFIVWTIAIPLAGLLVMIGGVLLIVGQALPKMYDLGRTILWGTFWGITLILTSWIIINLVMTGLGYQGTWFIF